MNQSLTPQRKIVKRHKVNFVEQNGRMVSCHGFNVEALEEHLLDHLTCPDNWRKSTPPEKGDPYEYGEWCDLACCSRTFLGRAGAEGSPTEAAIRTRVSRSVKGLLARGVFMLRDKTGKYNSIKRIKMFNPGDERDYRWANSHREQLLDETDGSVETLEKINRIMGIDLAGHILPDKVRGGNGECQRQQQP
jgi:hypothetical protein